MASIKLTVMNVEDKESIIKNGIWFSGKCHSGDGFTEISSDTICAVCCDW